jgi:valyl-tRNA synthetase
LTPFITEEIWQQVAPRAGVNGETIMLQSYPAAAETGTDAGVTAAIADIEWVRQFILGIRQIRGEVDIAPGKALPVLLGDASELDLRRARDYAALIGRVGRVDSMTPLAADEQPPDAATALLGDLRLLVPMKGLIDVEVERGRLSRQLAKIEGELQKCSAKLGNEKFVANAPADVVTQEQERHADFSRQLEQLAAQLAKLDELA